MSVRRKNSQIHEKAKTADNRKAAKIILVGDISVGKTSLVQRLVNDQFTDHYETTIGAAFACKIVKVNGKNVKCSLWDTAGQERFNSFAPLYFRDASAAIVVYDVANMETLELATKWIGQLRLMAPEDLVVLLAGNKMDLAINRRLVDRQTAQDLATKNGLLFAEISAKSGRGVEQMFLSIAEAIVAKDARETANEVSSRLVTLGQPRSQTTADKSGPCEC